MSTLPSRFTELPVEISEWILLHLPGQDIIKMEAVCPSRICDNAVLILFHVAQVNRHFMDLVRSSPTLQYYCELFSAGLIDNSHPPWNLAERRKLCRKYVNRWTRTAKVVRRTHEIPTEPPTWTGEPRWSHMTALGEGLLSISHPYQYGGFKFLPFPPVASQHPVKGWSIPQFPFEVGHSAAYVPDNLLVVTELGGQ